MRERTGRCGALSAVILMVACVGCSSEGRPDAMSPAAMAAVRESLMEADRAFNRATQERGADGWVSFFDAEGAMIQQGVGEIRGLEDVRKAAESMFTPGVTLTWDPVRAHASDDGTLGFTVGGYDFTASLAEGGQTVAQGRYVSIWRKQTDGSWKVLMDLGNPTN